MNKKIIWEDINIQTNLLNGSVEEISDLEFDNLDENLEEMSHEELISSPFGMFRIRDYFNPMRQYNWYMAHTNFNVTNEFINNLSIIDGVEKLVPISRYRFLIAFGKCFSEEEVQENINKTFGIFNYPEEILEKVNDLKELYNKWVIYFKNDIWEYGTDEEFETKLLEFQKKKDTNGGIIITHETNI